jgi:hypothetical protein
MKITYRCSNILNGMCNFTGCECKRINGASRKGYETFFPGHGQGTCYRQEFYYIICIEGEDGDTKVRQT